jgi:hypothetical protein
MTRSLDERLDPLQLIPPAPGRHGGASERRIARVEVEGDELGPIEVARLQATDVEGRRHLVHRVVQLPGSLTGA